MRRWIVLGSLMVAAGVGIAMMAYAQEASQTVVVRRQTGGEMAMAMGDFGMGRGMAGGERMLAMLDNDRVRAMLNLTDDQAAKLRQIVVDTQKSAIKTRADIEVAGIDLRELLLQDNPDRGAVMKQVDTIAGLGTDLAKEYVDALLKAKTILTPEQQKKIRTFIEMRGMMRGRGQGGGMGQGMGGMMGPGMRGGTRQAPPPKPPDNPNPPSQPNF
jgi:periplasmic protein CpxP/Spy